MSKKSSRIPPANPENLSPDKGHIGMNGQHRIGAVRSRPVMVLLAALCTSMTALGAEPSSATKLEVDWLLVRLGASGCRFQRNGTWYGAAQARLHLEQKYQYLLNKQLIGTTENFISLAATKSSMSGNPYQVQCGAEEQMYSAAWMTMQLREVRAVQPEALPKAH
jgi:hypothetical protein